MTKPATENALDQREAERDCYRQLATVTRIDQRNGGRRVDTTTRCIPRGLTAEMACADDDDNPNLSAWTRARLAWTRLLASIRR